MDDVKEEIKSRLSVEDVVGQYLELKRAGRNLKGHSPWGVDRTPSFMVSPEKGIWHDFSANKGGDIFTFVMEVEGITFREALEKLAAQAGVTLEKYGGDSKKLARKKARSKEVLEWACKFYQVCLSKNRKVCEYVFYKRNLNRATVNEFRIGYAPAIKNSLVNFLKKKGFTTTEMNDAGLLNQYGGDLFRGRMMIPFIDASGTVIGFTARILDQGEPKYLNTPETLLFNKSRFIFGYHHAKEAIRRDGFVVIVEGNMDVISSHQAGVKQAVATSGTAMTELHLKALSRLTPDIRLAYDGDDAGVRAAERAIMLAGKLGINLSIISDYNGAKDPDELIQRDPKLWQAAVKDHLPAVEWLLKKYQQTLDLTSGDGKREYSDIAMRVINFLSDPVEQTHYKKLVARQLDVAVSDLEAKKLNTNRTFYKKVKTEFAPSTLAKSLENDLLSIMIYGGTGLDFPELSIPEDEVVLADLELVFAQRFSKLSPADLTTEAAEIKSRLDQETVALRIAELQSKLLDEPDEEAENAILREIITLRKTIK